ncbi:MAG: sulfatase [Thermoguttaceae bacterium]|nr:sulfatase [Thermoguttaceae bacterium]MDW8078270.1 sulfatase [Thermoguttaceae bacterium]
MSRLGLPSLTVNGHLGKNILVCSTRVFSATVLLATILLGIPSFSAGASQPAAGKPNILFIAIDDLNDWTGFLGGHPQAQTPHLDGLAKRGMVFTRAYCAAPACNPSRTAILTGIMPASSGVYHNNNPWRPQLPEAVTLFQHFRQHNYKVFGGGKLFHGPFNDVLSWEMYWARPGDPMPPGRPLNGIPNAAQFDWGPLDVDDGAMGDAKLTDWAIWFLQQEHDRPFFLAVGYIRPHLPWYVPRPYFERFPLANVILPRVKENDLDDIPPLGRKIANPQGDHARVLATNNWHRAVQGYLASIAFVDYQVGRLLQAFYQSPYVDNTIVVLWGDHGWHLGQKQHWRKFALWEEATRVPLIIVVPGLTKPGSRCGRTVNLADLYPTLCELAGLPIPPQVETRSLVPLLKDPEHPWDRPAITTHGYMNHAVRSEQYRYIRYSDGSEELYDHEVDPLEWTNLANDPKYQQIKDELAKWLPQVNREEGPRVQERQPARIRRQRKTADLPPAIRAYLAQEWFGEIP